MENSEMENNALIGEALMKRVATEVLAKDKRRIDWHGFARRFETSKGWRDMSDILPNFTPIDAGARHQSALDTVNQHR